MPPAGEPQAHVSNAAIQAVVNWCVIRRLLCSLLLVVLALAGCHSGSVEGPDPAPRADVKIYKMRGKVVATDAAKGEVTMNHEAIPGFMDAMTMPYKVKDENVLSELHPGDVLTADVVVSRDPNADPVLDHIVVVAEGKPDYRPPVVYHVPTAGDALPDFKLRNQDGRAIHLGQFRGKALLVTFIYTRCPLPNFCPRVTHNFAAIERELGAEPDLLKKTQLVCISFDPENDTPARLRAYGATYIGSDEKSAFANWDFAAPDKATLKELAKFFDLGFSGAADGTITHTLSTTLIGPDGKVVRFYPGNDWTVEQVLGDVKRAAGNG
jgi:protein SCO1/2